MKKINKNFFINSLLLHLLIIISFLLFNTNNKITNRFIVFGAHSKKPTQAYFKPLKLITKSDWLKTRRTTQRKPAPRKVIKKPIIKKTKTVPKKKLIAKRTPPKQTKRVIIKKESKRIPIKKAIAKKEIKEQENKTTPEKEIEQEELHFNLMGNNDPQLVKYQKQIQKEVGRLWRPPVGVPKGTECSLCFIVNSKGKISKFEVIKPSEILIYDLSILRIAKKFEFDKSLWNKKLTIDFRQ